MHRYIHTHICTQPIIKILRKKCSRLLIIYLKINFELHKTSWCILYLKDYSSRDLLCLIVSLMNFLVKGCILNDVNDSLTFLVSVESSKPTFPLALGPRWVPSLTMAKCERQHPWHCCILPDRLSTSWFFFFFQKSSLKKLTASDGTFTLLTFQICSAYRPKHDFSTNRFHQVWEMKSNRPLFLLNTLPPTRFPDSKIKTVTLVSRSWMT